MNIELIGLSARVNMMLTALREWQALEYTGHFIDLDPEQKERVSRAAMMTDKALEQWGASVKPPPEQITTN